MRRKADFLDVARFTPASLALTRYRQLLQARCRTRPGVFLIRPSCYAVLPPRYAVVRNAALRILQFRHGRTLNDIK
jgi:hypothetical protein